MLGEAPLLEGKGRGDLAARLNKRSNRLFIDLLGWAEVW
jgi:hypothetical protein